MTTYKESTYDRVGQDGPEDEDCKKHAPQEMCYACLGTGKIVGFGNTGKDCPCQYVMEEG